MSTAAKFGGGLVEISAVATIIGAPTAEMLMHGLKGACGMAWAPMSAFGAIHITKACLAAIVPDFLREASGLRNAHVDNAIGVAMPVNSRKRAKNRVDMGDAQAIQVISRSKYDLPDPGMQELSRRSSRAVSSASSSRWLIFEKLASVGTSRRANCVYVTDRNARLALSTVYPSNYEQGEAIKVHRFEPDLAGRTPIWKDWLILVLSAVKVLEAIALWHLGASKLWYWTCIGWAHAFVAAVFLQLSGLGRDSVVRPMTDIVSGNLPSALHLGGESKIVLQVPSNVRRHFLWKLVLGSGALFNAAGLLGTFLFLGKEIPIVIYTWVGFQILWLLSRTMVYYFVENAAAARQGVMLSMTWDESSHDDQIRVLDLLGELSKHQVSTHPRGVIAYQYDCLDFARLSLQLEEASWQLIMQLPLPEIEASVWKITIQAVAGDPMIRSVIWFTGSKLDNSELYDSAIAFVHLDNQVVATPCVRVWCCDCLQTLDSSRGNAHPDCGMIKWLHFIPFSSVRRKGWLIAYSHIGVGLLMTEMINDDDLNTRLEQGRYHISMQSIRDLTRALEVSRKGALLTRDFLKSAVRYRQQSSATETMKVTRDNGSSKSPLVSIRSS